jgi:hypothetical protein
MKKMFVAAAIAAVAFIATPSKASAASFAQCPAVGADTLGCQFLFTVNADGSITTQIANPDQGPYDGVEDTLFGVQNNSSSPVPFFDFSDSGTDLFGFEGDGACTTINCGPGGHNASDSSGYGGYVFNAAGANVGDVFYSNIHAIHTFADSGRVNFGANGIPAGGTAWFSLEESFSLNTVPTPRAGVPEPTSLILLGTGILAVARRLRKA